MRAVLVLAILLLLPGCVTQEPPPPAGGGSSTCATLSPEGLARDRVAVATDGESVYAFGGIAPDGAYRDDVVRVDPATGASAVVAHLAGGARAGIAVAWTGERFLLFGGFTRIRPGGGGDTVGTVESWVPGEALSRPLPVALSPPRGHAALVWDGSRAWLFGGDTGQANLDLVTVYDPATGALADREARLPTPRSLSSGVWTGEAFYLLGGHGNDGRHDADVVRYLPAEGVMRVVAALRAPIAGGIATLQGGRVLYWGGHEQNVLGRDLGETDLVQAYALGSGVVTQAGALPHARASFGLATLPHGTLVLGGAANRTDVAAVDACPTGWPARGA